MQGDKTIFFYNSIYCAALICTHKNSTHIRYLLRYSKVLKMVLFPLKAASHKSLLYKILYTVVGFRVVLYFGPQFRGWPMIYR